MSTDPIAGGPEAAPPSPLSSQEETVLRLIALGHSNKEIAARMLLSVKTVETYKARAMEKLDLLSRVELVRYAASRGWYADLGPVRQRRTSPEGE